MAKKPRLTLVDQTTPTVLSPPTTLGKTGGNLWRTIMTEYDVRDSGGREMLRQICEAADRIDEFAAIIKADGATIRTKTGLRDHPLLKHELAARGFITKSLHRLGLDVEPVRGIGRPTQAIGWRGSDHADE